MSSSNGKLVFLCTHGPETAEKATLPLAMALGAMASDIEAVVILQSEAVLLARKGVAEHVFSPGMTGMKVLIDEFTGSGGRLIACHTCLASRKIEKEDLVESVQLGSVSLLAKEFTEAANVICY